jgi:hypothetical protein
MALHPSLLFRYGQLLDEAIARSERALEIDPRLERARQGGDRALRIKAALEA